MLLRRLWLKAVRSFSMRRLCKNIWKTLTLPGLQVSVYVLMYFNSVDMMHPEQLRVVATLRFLI